jgi:hypothetical protein
MGITASSASAMALAISPYSVVTGLLSIFTKRDRNFTLILRREALRSGRVLDAIAFRAANRALPMRWFCVRLHSLKTQADLAVFQPLIVLEIAPGKPEAVLKTV